MNNLVKPSDPKLIRREQFSRNKAASIHEIKPVAEYVISRTEKGGSANNTRGSINSRGNYYNYTASKFAGLFEENRERKFKMQKIVMNSDDFPDA